MRLLDRPRVIGLASAAAATLLGMVYLAAAGAPERYLAVNLAAFAIGAAIWSALTRVQTGRLTGGVVLALGIMVAATAWLGVTVGGASRWIPVGPLRLHSGLLLVPVMVVLHARRADVLGTTGILLAAAGLAAQPDRAMAGALLAAMAVLAWVRLDRPRAWALAGAGAAFAATLARADTVPPAPFVEGVLASAWGLHAAVGLAVLTGCLILLLPGAGGRGTAGDRAAPLAFAATWAVAIVAAAVGNYPTPLVGYGASAILGYLLSSALLPGRVR